jgi:hypothetical protein
MSPNERFAELVRALRWKPDRLVAMLWAYFDESGLHKAETGKLDWLVLGGAIASEEDWEHVSIEWEAALNNFGITTFHMADFESNEGEFKNFSIDNHKALLNRLLEIQAKYVHNIFGVSNWTGRYIGPYQKIYHKNVIDILTIIWPSCENDLISLVFARHKEVSFSKIGEYFDEAQSKHQRFGSWTVDDPSNNPPLQMADLIAYEFARSIRDGFPIRYPYKFMTEHATVGLFLLMEVSMSGRSSGRGQLSLSE